MRRYRVRPTWPFRYREYEPGEEFVADLEPDVEERAVRKGALEVLDDARDPLDPASATPPKRRGS
jgi:hypothetical protein